MGSVGVVGLGLIGAALCRRLVATGPAPVVYDIRAQALEAAVSTGSIAAKSSREVAERCEIVLVAVQTDDQCLSAVAGRDGLLEGAQRESCIAILSTVLPETIKSLAMMAAQRGVALVDSPLAGHGMFSVADGTMSALVGDDGPAFERLRPTLLRFASNVVPAGGLGSGAALKLAHNIVAYAGIAAMVEAMELARAAAVRDGLVETIAGRSGALSELGAFAVPFYKHFRDDPHAPEENEMLQVAAALLEKDLSDAVALGISYEVELPLASFLSHMGGRIFQVDL